MRVSLPEARYSLARTAAFYHQLQDRVRGLPGVEAVAIVNQLPMSDVTANVSFDVEGRPANTDINVADTQIISPDYFRAMGISLMRGQFLNDGRSQPSSRFRDCQSNPRPQSLAGDRPYRQATQASAERSVAFCGWSRGRYQESRLECRDQARDLFPAYRPAGPTLGRPTLHDACGPHEYRARAAW